VPRWRHASRRAHAPPDPTDLLALLTSLKTAVMLDYWFERCAAPGEALAAVGQMILELRAAYAAGCPEIAELRCVQLGDCVFLLRPSLLRARREGPPPLLLRLDGQDARVSPHTGSRDASARADEPDAAASWPPPRRRGRHKRIASRLGYVQPRRLERATCASG
jgi:hypothetical protein